MVEERAPSGRIMRTPDGRDLVFTRRMRAAPRALWSATTVPEEATRWLGDWTGPQLDAASIMMRVPAPEGPGGESEVGTIECNVLTVEAPTDERPAGHLELASGTHRDDAGEWHVQIRVAEHVGLGVLTLVHHLTPTDRVEVLGPFWEHRLDRLAWVLGELAAEPDPDEVMATIRRHYARFD